MLQTRSLCIKRVGGKCLCAYCNGACIKYGKTANAKQRYYCKQCRKTAVDQYTYHAYYTGTTHNIVALLCEGCGIRNTARLLHIATGTVIKRILLTAAAIQKPYVPMHQTFEME